MENRYYIQNTYPYGSVSNPPASYYTYPQMGGMIVSVQPGSRRYVRRPDTKILPPVQNTGLLQRQVTPVPLPPLHFDPMFPSEQPPPERVERKPVEPPPELVQEEIIPKKDKKAKPDKKKGKKKKKSGKVVETELLRFPSRDERLSWGCDGQLDDAIGFTCDHDISLIGFLLFGPSQYQRGTYYIRARLQDEKGNVVKGSPFSAEVDANPRDKFYTMPFKKAIDIEKDKRYVLVVNLLGDPTFQGSNGYQTVHVDEMTFKFFDTELSQNGTNVQHGQIPGLVINTVN